MENQTLASITFQNFFRMYKKLSGMAGTAKTEAQELKYAAIIKLIREYIAKRQFVLVGTISIEKSEHLSSLLKKEGISHYVLNARYNNIEAEIIADAGKPGSVKTAIYMAGCGGTDIKLRGNLEM